MIDTVPFRRCDNKNLELSEMCTFDNNEHLKPSKWAQDVKKEVENNEKLNPFVKFPSNLRYCCSNSIIAQRKIDMNKKLDIVIQHAYSFD